MKKSWLQRSKKGLSRVGKSDTAKLKREIQALVREIVIIRDKGCLLKGYKFACSNVLQADHLITRGKNVGYADTRLIICLCSGHHTAKTFDDNNEYEPLIRNEIGEKRAKLWDMVRADRKSYPMSAWDWTKVIIGLKKDLADLENAKG